MKKKALNKSAFISYQKKKGGQEMITLYKNLIIKHEFDAIQLIQVNTREVLSTITLEGLIHIQQLNLSPYRIRKIKQFMKMYTVLGFYNQESERIYKEYFM